MRARVLFGLVMVAALVGIYVLDAHVFGRAMASRLLLWVLAVGAMQEVFALGGRRVERNPGLFLYGLIALLAILVPYLVTGRPVSFALLAIAAVAGGGVRLLGMAPLRSAAAAFPEALLFAGGLLYTAGLLSFLDRLLVEDLGTGFAVVAVAKMTDICGYLVGTLVGRRRIVPAVSPRKTWEGTIAGLLGAAGVAALLAPDLAGPPAFAALVGLLVGAASFLGDLCGSGLKRWAGVKDSAVLLPEYGGFLDLLDGILLAGPVGVVCLLGT